MGTYQYKARDKFAKLVSGVMGADSESAVAVKLKQMGYTPVLIKEAQDEPWLNKFLARFRRVSPSELNMFTRQFVTLQRAGLPIVASLNALKQESGNPILLDVVGQLIRDIEAGATLSSALERHPKVFNPLYANMVRSGEISGRLDEVLDRLATLGEHQEMIDMRIKAATRYPIIVVVAIVLGFLGLTTMVIPRFAKLYGQFATELPLPTRILLTTNYITTHFWWLLIIIIFGVIFGFKKILGIKEVRFWWDSFKLKIPIFGQLFLKLNMSRFSRITGMLMQSGIPVLQVLDLASAGVSNKVIARTIEQIKIAVTEGRGMTEPMKISGMFPAVVVNMVAVGEETGKLDELLLHISSYYDLEVDYTINNLTSLIEPILIFSLGCVVLFMALGIFMPMWNLMSLFKR